MGLSEIEKIKSMCNFVRNNTKIIPTIAFVLGSGLGDSFNDLDVEFEMDFRQIPYMPRSTVAEHPGKLVIGTYHGKGIALLRGRIHFYEGYTMPQVVRPIRLLNFLGAKTIILTNSAGAINATYKVGDIVSISDQIASFVPNPLRNFDANASIDRFPDMSNIYDPKIRCAIKNTGAKLNLSIAEGVYLQTSGPSFESKAEISMYRQLGADLVGMSTACEAIAAKQLGCRIGGVSFISNKACGLSDTKLSMEEVIENSNINKALYSDFLELLLQNLLEGNEYENKDI